MTFANGLAVGVADAASDVPLEGTPDRMSRIYEKRANGSYASSN